MGCTTSTDTSKNSKTDKTIVESNKPKLAASPAPKEQPADDLVASSPKEEASRQEPVAKEKAGKVQSLTAGSSTEGSKQEAKKKITEMLTEKELERLSQLGYNVKKPVDPEIDFANNS
eukprot:TRINITY_DN9816_c0_g1_i10.p2 TRINITY_DN9816_c0_g1~~TRINITY_DN9816_c0_g1_i10.p2  ORF type:complete len:118 (+),score=40.81 TRINITY_DN9816_c0_g1_i10:76-429(+)